MLVYSPMLALSSWAMMVIFLRSYQQIELGRQVSREEGAAVESAAGDTRIASR